MVFGHSEVLVGCFIRNDFRFQSLEMRQTLDKWTWCNTPARVPIAPNRNSTTCCHQIGWTRCWSQIPYQSLKIVSQDLGFGISDCLLGGDDDRTIFRIGGAEILNPHGFPSPVNISRFLSFNYVPSEIQSQMQAHIQIRMEIWISPLVKIS